VIYCDLYQYQYCSLLAAVAVSVSQLDSRSHVLVLAARLYHRLGCHSWVGWGAIRHYISIIVVDHVSYCTVYMPEAIETPLPGTPVYTTGYTIM